MMTLMLHYSTQLKRALFSDYHRELVRGLEECFTEHESLDWLDLKKRVVQVVEPKLNVNHFQTLCGTLRPQPGETMVNYARRFKWYLDFSEMDPLTAAKAFMNEY